MKCFNRRTMLAGTAAVAAGSLAACTGGGSNDSAVDPSKVKDGEIKGEISFQTWSLKNDKFTPYFNDLIAAFEKEHPGVKVKWIDQPGDGYEDKLLQQANADQIPDVVNVPPEYALSLARVGKLLDLKAADADAMKEYIEGGIKAYEFHGLDGSYGYPWYLGVAFNYWNKDSLTKAGLDSKNPPANEESFQQAALEAAEKGVALLSQVPQVGFFSARGIDVFDENSRKFIFANKKAEKLLQTYVDLYKKGAMPAELLTSVDNGQPANEAFFKGTLGNIQSTPSFAGTLETDAPNIVDKVEVTAPWEKPQLLVQGISVSGTSKNPATALEFAKFVTNNQNQVNFVKIAKGFMPGTVEGNKNPQTFVDDSDKPLMKQALAVSAKTVQRAELLYPVEMSNEMKTAVLQEMALAMRGEIAPMKALEAAQEKCNKMMAELDS